MVFSSMVFLCIFLPVTFLLQLSVRSLPLKNGILLAASLLFYAYGEPVYCLLLIGSSFLNYLFALGIERWRKAAGILVKLDVILNLGMLILYKYSGFLAEIFGSVTGMRLELKPPAMPLGISFFTFQAMSYVIDVYRGKVSAQKRFTSVLLYISFFPQLIAGPIVKYHDIACMMEERKLSAEDCAAGIRRFCAGLCRKVLIANTLGACVDQLYAAGAGSIGCAGAWIAAVSYMLQIYFDFSGYSDMAIGMGLMFGFRFKENFNEPYSALGIRDFWRRWHISLSGWFREYLYIPLGGNRKGKRRTMWNRMLVFLCTGIWHGASLNFLFWGFYHGCFQLLETACPKVFSPGGKRKDLCMRIYTLLTVMIGFIFFRAETLTEGFRLCLNLIRPSLAGPAGEVLMQMTPLYLLTLAAAVFFCCPIRKRCTFLDRESVGYVLSLAGLVLCMLRLSAGSYNPFIYFRF